MSCPSLTVRSLTFTATRPAIIVPLVGPDAATLEDEATRAAAAGADCLEWRVDLWQGPLTREAITGVVAGLREAAGDRPLLATLRTTAEGGEAEIDENSYLAAIRLLVAGGVDLVDVEILRVWAREAIAAAHGGGVPVVGSRHSFGGTPPEDAIVAALAFAENLGADIAKVAVMPSDALDTLTLLRATARRFEHARVPLVAIAMGDAGVLSRVVGPAFGSCATFATVPDAIGIAPSSAPGQAPIATVRAALDALARVATHTGRPQ